MFTLTHIFQSVIALFQTDRDSDERYLAQATDLCDLERRLRVLEDRGRDGAAGLRVGLYAG